MRIHELDGIRGIAILTVLAAHCFTPTSGSLLSSVIFELFRWFWLGVDLFFVLSGFLITSILLKNVSHQRYFFNFYFRRVLRIFPAYYLTLCLCYTLIPSAMADGKLEVGNVFLHIAYLQNWQWVLSGYVHFWDGLLHTWSLAVEEQFYFFWPLFIRFAPTRYREFICVSAIILVILAKLAMWTAGVHVHIMFMGTFSRFDPILMGAWVAIVLDQGGSNFISFQKFRVLAIVCATAFLTLFFFYSGIVVSSAIIALVTPVASVMFAFSVYSICTNRLPKIGSILLSPFLAWFGRYSYGIYLLHWPILVALKSTMRERGYFEPFVPTGGNIELLVIGSIATALSTVLAYAMFHLVEIRFMQLKKLYE